MSPTDTPTGDGADTPEPGAHLGLDGPGGAAARHRGGGSSPVLRALGIAGRVLVGLGVVLLLFTAYQVWGTTWSQEHTQASLRQQLQKELHRSTPAHKTGSAGAAHTPAHSGPPIPAGTIAAPAAGDPVGVLIIPSIGVDQVVVEGTGESELAKGPGHYSGTPLPGEDGNVGIAGHRTTWGHPFWALSAVRPGDRIIVQTVQGTFTYRATATPFVVTPTDVTVLAATTTPSITLTTCNPRFSAAQRLVVRGVLTASQLSGAPLHYVSESSTPHHSSTQLAGSSSQNWGGVILWGLVILAVGTLAWFLAQRWRRWAIYLASVPILLVLLYLFFRSITPHLPASL